MEVTDRDLSTLAVIFKSTQLEAFWVATLWEINVSSVMCVSYQMKGLWKSDCGC